MAEETNVFHQELTSEEAAKQEALLSVEGLNPVEINALYRIKT